eukprot:TRINITY_DN31349_c0_g1_i1.p1 TRINITY_DN31349_c0_g1~~TRINITY_DN31349_c0_g1_i1.p1  ORF type:complete len:283 (+),score=30.46 TRINITY_DN31349_c0_g1_i1:81-851(+)
MSNRLNVFPTRMALTVMKNKLKGAIRGHSLLKKKADALTMRFRAILYKIAECKEKMGATMKEASFSLVTAKWAASPSDIASTVLENVGSASFKVNLRSDNVAGVHLPAFQKNTVEQATELTGLGKGGQQIQKCKETYLKALEGLVELASYQTAFVTLDEVIRITNRRVNAIDCVVRPKLENTISYIISELDEGDREEFFRLKKVQGKKKKVIADKEAARQAFNVARDADEASRATQEEVRNILDEGPAAEENLLIF